MDSITKAPKRIITKPSVSKVSEVSAILDSALQTLSEQIDLLSRKSAQGTFSPNDAKMLQGYITSLVALSKEEREREKSDKLGDLAKLSDDELLELAKQTLLKTANS